MATCDVCGNDYDNCLILTQGGRSGTFDCLQCAIHAFAPRCAHCGCTIIGHGTGSDGGIYCCAHCADQASGTSSDGHANSDAQR